MLTVGLTFEPRIDPIRVTAADLAFNMVKTADPTVVHEHPLIECKRVAIRLARIANTGCPHVSKYAIGSDDGSNAFEIPVTPRWSGGNKNRRILGDSLVVPANAEA